MIKKLSQMQKDDIINNLGQTSLKAMLYEISCYPSPGLVSPVSNGAHKDMDHFTFLDSIAALAPFMYKFAECGNSIMSPKGIFDKLRFIGLGAEDAMLETTKGINTYKGMIFLMGISVAATAKAVFEKKSFEDISHIIKDMTRGIVDRELSKRKNIAGKDATYGEKIYEKYNISGVRGEVEGGLSTVFKKSLPYYESIDYLDQQQRLVQTLLYIMSNCEDTNILHRHPIQKLQYVKDLATHALDLGGMETIEGRDAINNLDFKFSKEKISPGGSADLLAITIYFSMIKILM